MMTITRSQRDVFVGMLRVGNTGEVILSILDSIIRDLSDNQDDS